jgi:adenylate cyclase
VSESDGPGAALDLAALVDQVEARLLGGRPEFTRAEVAEASGLAPEAARDLWRALGFATVDDDERAFTAGDIEALKRVRGLGELMPLDDELLRSMTRMLGRSFSRLASWQGQLVVEQFGKSPELARSGEDILDYLDRMLATMEELQGYVWRRQLAAYFSRVASNAGASGVGGRETTMAVGFADLAQFTAFTRRSSEAELRTMLESFESTATDVVGGHRGQIVKTIGDEVLFVADQPDQLAYIGLELVEERLRNEDFPELRVGLGWGPAVSRLGDVLGPVVNVASRLTSTSRPGRVLIDRMLADQLADDEHFRLRRLRRTSVKGYRRLEPWGLRRPVDEDPELTEDGELPGPASTLLAQGRQGLRRLVDQGNPSREGTAGSEGADQRPDR